MLSPAGKSGPFLCCKFCLVAARWQQAHAHTKAAEPAGLSTADSLQSQLEVKHILPWLISRLIDDCVQKLRKVHQSLFATCMSSLTVYSGETLIKGGR